MKLEISLETVVKIGQKTALKKGSRKALYLEPCNAILTSAIAIN